MAKKSINDTGAQGGGAFTKEQLLSSERFRDRRDLLNALLKGDKLYSVSQAEGMIEIYMKGKVK